MTNGIWLFIVNSILLGAGLAMDAFSVSMANGLRDPGMETGENFRIAGTFVCIRHLGLGLEAAWACMIAHNLLLFALFTWHYLTGRWNPFSHPSRAAR